MSDAARQELSHGHLKKFFFYTAVGILTVPALVLFSLKMYLLSPYPARQLSTLLSGYLHQEVKVQALYTSGPQLILIGISVADPPGFPGKSLLTARTLAIKPYWGEFLLGRRDFRLIELDELRIDLHRNSAGVWNFAALRQLFAKPAAGETLIRRLSVTNGSLRVNGQGVRDITLTVHDLATKGSKESRIELTCQDDARNRYTLNGTGRGGSDAVFALNLKAPSLSLVKLDGLTKQKNQYFTRARGDLQLAASLRTGKLLAHGEMGFTRIEEIKRIGPVSGRLLFDASYHQQSDQARLERLDLLIDNLLQLHGTGEVNGLKNERTFELALKIADLDLQRLSSFLPAETAGKVSLAGTLGKTAVHLAGTAREGMTAVSGRTELREFSLKKEGRLWIGGLSGSVVAQKQAAGITLMGELSSRGTQAALESIQAPFTLLLSPRLKPHKAYVTLSHARFMGLALGGRARYDHVAPEPFSASLQGTFPDLASVNPLLEHYGLKIDSGSGAATLQAGGRDALNFTAALDLTVTDLHGNTGESRVSLKQGRGSAQISRSRGELAISGHSELNGVAAAGKSGQARLDYRLAGRRLTLENGSVDWDGSTIRLARLTVGVPVAENRQGAVYVPLAIEFSGGDVTHRSADTRGLSGRLDGYLVRNGTARWLEGRAALTGGQLGWQGKPVAVPRAQIAFNRSGATASISGTLLGGELAGDASCNPFAVSEGASFALNIRGADLSRAAGLLPPRNGATVTEGRLDGSAAGSYSRRDGLNARVQATGNGVTVARGGKVLVSRAGIGLSGTIAGQKIIIRNARATAGDGVAITVDGTVEHAFTANRQGSINLAVALAPFDAYVDAFVNTMPRFVQEATVDGSLAAHGTLTLHEGRSLLQGALLFSRIRLDSPGQALDLSDLDGSFPFSLDLSGTTSASRPLTADFTRDNFQQLQHQLERPTESGQVVTIGRIALGRMELGPVTLRVRAANGLTEIVSLRAPLYEGRVLGTGWLLMKHGINYRGDLLLSGLSLKELCNRFPTIKGYISGRVDGIVSLYGEGSGISGLYGFVDLWANEAKGEKMQVSREFLQRLGGKKLSGVFFRTDIPYDRAEISALLEQGYLSFDTLDIVHTNIFGVRDLNVSIAPAQNRIALDHLVEAIKQASASGKAAGGQVKPAGEEAPAPEFKWDE